MKVPDLNVKSEGGTGSKVLQIGYKVILVQVLWIGMDARVTSVMRKVTGSGAG